MQKFWKYFTLFGEILIFVPILILVLFVNKNIQVVGFVENIAIFLHKYISYLSLGQINLLLLLGICILLQEIIGGAIKYFFFKPRPNPMEWNNWFEKIEAGSFPSLHSARTFCLFLFAIYFTNIYVGVAFFFFWLLISYSRVYLKKHFIVDIFGGIILALLTFNFIYFLLANY